MNPRTEPLRASITVRVGGSLSGYIPTGRTLTEVYEKAPGYVRCMYREITELRPHLEEALE